MNVSEQILSKISEAMSPSHIELLNESHMHAGPATNSHFKLVLVSALFEGQSRVKRHQMIYQILREELQASSETGTVHALALHLFSPEEWEQSSVPDSPQCAGKK